MTIAVLIAGGTGARMGQNIPKQFLNVQDKPVIVYTMERFQRNPEIDGIVVVTLPNWTEFVWAYAKQFGDTPLEIIVPYSSQSFVEILVKLPAGNVSAYKNIYNSTRFQDMLKTIRIQATEEAKK